MANSPYHITPAVLDATPIMQGLGSLIKDSRDKAKKEKLASDFKDVMATNDVQQINEFRLKNPESDELVSGIIKNKNEGTRKNMAQTMINLDRDPNKFAEYLNQRNDYLATQGDADGIDTQNALTEFAENPEQALQNVRNLMPFVLNKQEWDAYESQQGLGKDGKISFGAGRTVIVDANNDTFMATEIRDPSAANKTRMEYSPIGETKSPTPVGKVKIASEYGESAAQMQDRKAAALKVEQQNKINIKNADEVMTAYIGSQAQIANYDEAIEAIDADASTSRAASLFPTMRAATAKLEAVGNRMALNILSTVSMGALSEKEMEVLQQTAMPKMPPEDLKIWLLERKAAEQKYADLLLEASRAYQMNESRTDFYTRKRDEFSGGGAIDSTTTPSGISYTVK